MSDYNKVQSDDDIMVINAKLKTAEYKGLSDREILAKLNQQDIYIMKPFEVLNGQIVRKD